MAWQQIKINVPAEYAELVGDMLSDLDAQAVSFLDAKDTPVYEPKPGEVLLWPETTVVGLYSANDDLNPVITKIKSQLSEDVEFHLKLDQLEDKDWEREWMKDFHPMKFGNNLWICPSWQKIPDESAVNIILDPGLAFGTGTHPTTAMCLEWLDSANIEGKVVVDFGCGSGVLACAALKLGAKTVIGIDIDPQALIASKENAKRNCVSNRLELYLPKDQPAIQADIVLANILAGPLRDLSKTISNFCKNDGHLVMSGVLEEQAHSVMAKYTKEFVFDPTSNTADWVRITGTKKLL